MRCTAHFPGILVIALLYMGFGHAQNASIKALKDDLQSAGSDRERLIVLDSLTEEMIRSDDPEQKPYLHQFIDLATRKGKHDMAAQKARFLIQWHVYQNQLDSAQFYVDRFKGNWSKLRQPVSKAHLFMKQGGIDYENHAFAKAITNYQKSIPLYQQAGDSIYIADANLFSGQAALELLQPVRAFEFFEDAYKLYKELGDLQYATSTGLELSSIYNRHGLSSQAIALRKEIIQIAQENDMPCAESVYRSQLLSSTLDSIKYDQFEGEFEKIKSLYSSCTRYMSTVMPLYANVLELKAAIRFEKSARARSAYQKLEQLIAEADNPYFQEYSTIPRATYLKSLGKYQEALGELKPYMRNSYTSPRFGLDILNLAAELHDSLGNEQVSNTFRREYISLKDSVYKAEVATKYAFTNPASTMKNNNAN